MKFSRFFMAQLMGVAVLGAIPTLSLNGQEDTSEPAAADDPARGKALTYDRSAGNCLACHMMADGELPGTSGPPLLQMRMRYPDRAVLRRQIWDATEKNPDSVMPPYGRHRILTEEEIDQVMDFVYSL